MNTNAGLRVKRLRPDAVLPRRATDGSIGYDLSLSLLYDFRADGSPRDIELIPLRPILFKLGIAIAIPEGYYGRIAPRSGLALKGVHVLGGVIDADYRGDVGVILVLLRDPMTTLPLKLEREKPIAQLILERADKLPVWEVEHLDDTERGGRGFGSTSL